MLDGRVVPASAYRPSSLFATESPEGWWTALVLFGGLVLAGAGLVAVRAGGPLVLIGVALCFLTVGLAAAERTDLATAVGSAGIVLSAVGIALVMGTVPTGTDPSVGMVLGGGTLVSLGLLGSRRARRRDRAADGPTRFWAPSEVPTGRGRVPP